MIFFVGDKPSKKNVDPAVPFVGTVSYKRLLEWIYQMDIDISEVYMCNISQIEPYGYIPMCKVNTPNYGSDVLEDDKVIALGNNAEEHLKKLNQKYFKLPHPSGRNHKLNDKKFLKKILTECKEYIG